MAVTVASGASDLAFPDVQARNDSGKARKEEKQSGPRRMPDCEPEATRRVVIALTERMLALERRDERVIGSMSMALADLFPFARAGDAKGGSGDPAVDDRRQRRASEHDPERDRLQQRPEPE